MMGTVWLRLHPAQDYIQPFVNAIVSTPLQEIRERDSLTCTNPVLWLSLHVLHGCCLRARLPRRPGNLCKGACEWIIRSNAVHHRQLPHWSSIPVYVSLPPSKRISLTHPGCSPHRHALLNRLILALQLPPRRLRLHDLGHVDIPRPRRRRKPGRIRHVDIPQLCHLARASSLCQRPMDERRRIPCHAHNPESLLEICLPLH